MPTRATAQRTAKKKTIRKAAVALAKRATAAAAAKKARLLREARGHLAHIARRKDEITEACRHRRGTGSSGSSLR